MPLVTNVIDDKSPLILYDTTWLSGTSQDDTYATEYVLPLSLDLVTHPSHSYYLGTFTTNNVTDGLVTFNFNGTAVWLYGANRPNHGSYTVQVDGATYTGFNGAGNNLFQQSLFNVSSLSQETHSIKLTNTASGGLYVDIDMVSQYFSRPTVKISMSHRLCGNRKLVIQTTSWLPKWFKTQIPAFNTKNQLGIRPRAPSTLVYSTMVLASKQYQLVSFTQFIS